MANTITGFNIFVTRTVIESAKMNTNLQLLKDHSPYWHKYSLTFADLQAAANTSTGTLFNADPKEVIHGYLARSSAAFAGGSITSVSFDVGLSTNRSKYVPALDILSTSTAEYMSQDFDMPSFDATTAVIWTAVAGGSTLDSLAAGAIDVWILKSIMV